MHQVVYPRLLSALLPLLFSILSFSVSAQKVTGIIKDKVTRSALIGATVAEKGTTNGTITDFNGAFELKVDLSTPKILVISYLGYKTLEIEVSDKKRHLDLVLEENIVVSQEVVISASRISEKLQESPVTVERMNVAAIKETPAVGFYEGLANLKGVDMTSASLGFKVINTRGFNSTSPVRTLQLIDGMDNQAPGLNFALGNFVGSSELDVESVELIVGANSATYGPNAFNGVINMTTKDPFKYRGLNVLVKGGAHSEGPLVETAVRYANVYREKLGFKVNVSYLTAKDFEARNYEPIDPRNTILQNPRNDLYGYDAINTYGEVAKNIRLKMNEEGDGDTAFADPNKIIFRTGYREKDLTDGYNTKSLKLNGALHYKIYKELTASYTYNFGTGSTIYQGENRYNIKDIKFRQHKLQLQDERLTLKAYTTLEDAGKSYDIVFTAFKLLESVKSNSSWFADFDRAYWEARQSGKTPDESLAIAREKADGVGIAFPTDKAYLKPGTPEFEEEFNKIVSNPSFKSGGTRFQDHSALRHYEARYDFDLSKLYKHLPHSFIIGSSYRKYDPESFGTIFEDTLNVKGDEEQGFKDISSSETGFYASAEKKLLKERIRIIGSLRSDIRAYDDSKIKRKYDPTFSPALSTVFKVRKNDFLRLTYTTAVRNPTLQDQFLFYNIGLIILSGNREGKSIILREDFRKVLERGAHDSTDFTQVSAIEPEQVQTVEIGYKGILADRVYLDASYYYSWYENFIGHLIGFQNSRPGYYQAYRVSANSKGIVTTQGLSFGLNCYFRKNYSLMGNYTFSELVQRDESDPLIPNYNTPKHKFNIGIAGRDIKKFGFNVIYKFVQGFDYTGSPQFTGYIPSYGLLDTQVNYKWTAWNTTLKFGVSNLLDNVHFEAYGAPYVGRFSYFSINYEM